ncbi:hypothetical protein C0Z18_25205 [Trinickia dabaoshanensis]|uniref:DUF805 domain-containing protein n=2 Tax=Trinickia dabaoshanensis TaxID=564714 RepID=A0A2N7VFU3_9BURK|nr:hypothetical protein C0Z18_25205 [Trinickia dabaoshanensis]
MGAMNIWAWLIGIVFTLAMLYPYVRIIRRTGHSGWWFLTMLVPVVNLIMIWVFAFAKWPAVDRVKQ